MNLNKRILQTWTELLAWRDRHGHNSNLNHFIAIYVPSTLQGNQSMPADVHLYTVRKIASDLSARLGGATVTKGLGCWLSDTHGLIEENVSIVKSYYDHESNSPTDVLVLAESLAAWIKAEYAQEAVSIETESGLQFV